jgi:hypothetical protein
LAWMQFCQVMEVQMIDVMSPSSMEERGSLFYCRYPARSRRAPLPGCTAIFRSSMEVVWHRRTPLTVASAPKMGGEGVLPSAQEHILLSPRDAQRYESEQLPPMVRAGWGVPALRSRFMPGACFPKPKFFAVGRLGQGPNAMLLWQRTSAAPNAVFTSQAHSAFVSSLYRQFGL